MLIFCWKSNSWSSFTECQCVANDWIRSGKVPKYEAPNQLGTYLMWCVNLWCKISCLSNRVTFGSGTSSCVRCIPLLWHTLSYICLHELNPCLDKPKQWYCGDYSLFVTPKRHEKWLGFLPILKQFCFPFPAFTFSYTESALLQLTCFNLLYLFKRL